MKFHQGVRISVPIIIGNIMKIKNINIAVLALAIGSSFSAHASTDFFGYARAGLHVSPDGQKGNGHPDYIRAEGAPNKYRLGNEDDWAELGIRHDLYEEGTERAEIDRKCVV